jgi:hypothetical protein
MRAPGSALARRVRELMLELDAIEARMKPGRRGPWL